MVKMLVGRIRFALALVVLLVSGAVAQDKPLKGVALVIGQSAYASLAPLPNPGNDARAVAGLLKGLGFEVSTLNDADAGKLRRGLDRFAEDAEGADVALLYYSGHGVEAGGENFLVPTDARPADPQGLASATDLVDKLKRTVPVAILLLDACRDNPFPAGATLVGADGRPQPIAAAGLGATRGVTRFVSDAPAKDSVGAVIGFAAEPGKVALDGEPGGVSPYAAALLKHLAAGGFDFADIMTLVTEEVYLRSEGRQIPWTNASLRRQLFFGGTQPAATGDDGAILSERRGLLLTIAALTPPDRAQVASVAREEGVPMDALFAALRAAGDKAPREPDAFDRLLRDQGAQVKSIVGATTKALTDPELSRLAGLADKAVREGALEAAIAFHAKARERMDELADGLSAVEAGTDALRRERAAVYAQSGATWLLAFEHAKAAEAFGRAFAEVDRIDDDLAIRYKLQEGKALADQGYYAADDLALDNAAEAFRVAIDMSPLRRRPATWIEGHAGLGGALVTRGDRESDPKRLEEAVDLLREAVKDLPADTPTEQRAELLSQLAYALLSLGMRETGIGSLDESAGVLLEAMNIVDFEKQPVAWARFVHRLAAAQYEAGRRTADPNALEAALATAEAALQVRTRERAPLDWMSTENNRAVILAELADRQGGTERTQQAIAAYQAVLEVGTRERGPLLWAETVSNLGSAQAHLAEWTGEKAHADAALASFRLAGEELTRERAPLRWAALQDNIGIVLRRQGEKTRNAAMVAEAAQAFDLALEERRRDVVPADWAATTGHLANTLWTLALMQKDPAPLDRAIAATREALAETPRDTAPRAWAMLRNNVGGMLADLGSMRDDTGLMLEAAAEYRAALEVFNPSESPVDWAEATGALGETLLDAGKRTGDAAVLEQARTALTQTEEIWTALGDQKRAATAKLRAAEAELAILQLDVAKRIKDAGASQN